MDDLLLCCTQADICPVGWGYFSGYCYLTSSVCASWVIAVSSCSVMKSHLVTVHNQEENVYIQRRHNGERSWIGLNDRSVEGSFVWTNKETTSFQFWAPQQPNNWKNEDCVHTLGAENGYTWNDVSCDKCYNYTCFKGTLSVTFDVKYYFCGPIPIDGTKLEQEKPITTNPGHSVITPNWT